jgi:hypothetical protein
MSYIDELKKFLDSEEGQRKTQEFFEIKVLREEKCITT